jgi:hypothetical protein
VSGRALAQTTVRAHPPRRRPIDAVRAWLGQRWQDFRHQPKFFQYRAYIVAAYVAAAVVTIIAVMPRTASNSLNAYVLAARGDFVVGSYILIRNDSGRDWSDVLVTVNETHSFSAPALAKGDRLTVRLKQLQGSPALKEADVHTVRVHCSRGEETYPVSFP